ncbi:MAG: hypothetical protein K6C99_01495 [Lachnospiraceae bacterium]|nr:hypothetical protein [Lachnospiraceae bacterium]
MSTEEEYLDRLLAQAMQPKKPNNDKDAAADKVIITEAPVSVSSGKGARGPKGNSVKNPKGNKDFSLDDVDAEQLAKEIADFEADADASLLPGNSELSEEALSEAEADPAGAGAEPTEETGFAENEPADEIQEIAPVQDTENKEFSEEALLAALNETGPVGGEIDALFESAPEASPEASFDAAELSELDAVFGDETAQEADFGTEEVAEAAPDADFVETSELETDAESVAEIDASPEAEIESASEVEIESAPEASPEASFDAAELSELDAAPEASLEASFDAAELSELDAAFVVSREASSAAAEP